MTDAEKLAAIRELCDGHERVEGADRSHYCKACQRIGSYVFWPCWAGRILEVLNA